MTVDQFGKAKHEIMQRRGIDRCRPVVLSLWVGPIPEPDIDIFKAAGVRGEVDASM
jgi:hypothetical protein